MLMDSSTLAFFSLWNFQKWNCVCQNFYPVRNFFLFEIFLKSGFNPSFSELSLEILSECFLFFPWVQDFSFSILFMLSFSAVSFEFISVILTSISCISASVFCHIMSLWIFSVSSSLISDYNLPCFNFRYFPYKFVIFVFLKFARWSQLFRNKLSFFISLCLSFREHLHFSVFHG